VEKWRHLEVAGAFFSVKTVWTFSLLFFMLLPALEGGTHSNAPAGLSPASVDFFDETS
jgi:hypothetical protein